MYVGEIFEQKTFETVLKKIGSCWLLRGVLFDCSVVSDDIDF
jgi:hypothetical protein